MRVSVVYFFVAFHGVIHCPVDGHVTCFQFGNYHDKAKCCVHVHPELLSPRAGVH